MTDPYRWITVREAARRLAMRRDRAVHLLRDRGLIRDLDGSGTGRVWLADLRDLAADDDASKAPPAAAPAPPPGLSLVRESL